MEEIYMYLDYFHILIRNGYDIDEMYIDTVNNIEKTYIEHFVKERNLDIEKICKEHNAFIDKNGTRYGIIGERMDKKEIIIGKELFSCGCIEDPLFIEIKEKIEEYLKIINVYNDYIFSGKGENFSGELYELRKYFKEMNMNEKVIEYEMLKNVLNNLQLSIKMSMNAAYGYFGGEPKCL